MKCFKEIALLTGTIVVLLGCGAESTTNVKELPDPALTGQFVDSPVSGLGYRSESVTDGITNENGEFSYFRGEQLTFYIGDLELPATAASSIITPLRVFATDSAFNSGVVNTLRLLQSLDQDGDPSNGITISSDAAASAQMVLTEGQTAADFFNRSPEAFAADVETWLANAGGITSELVPTDQAVTHFVDYLESTLGTLLPNSLDVSLFNGDVYFPLTKGSSTELQLFNFTPADETGLSGTFVRTIDGVEIAGEYNFAFGRRAIALTSGEQTDFLIARSFNTVNQVYSLCVASGVALPLATLVQTCDVDEDQKSALLTFSEEQAEIELVALEELANSVEPALLEAFDTDTATFFSASYKRLSEDADAGPMFYKTGGSPVLDSTQGTLTLAGARFTIGNAAIDPSDTTSPDDTIGTGVFNISQGFTLSFDVVDHNSGGSLNIYIDNNTTSQNNSVHGAGSKFIGLSISEENFPIGRRYIYTYLPGTDINGGPGDASDAKVLNTDITNSFFQFRTDSSGSITIDNLKIETLAETVDNGPVKFKCSDQPNLYFCDDFADGSTTNWEFIAQLETAEGAEGAEGSFDVVRDQGNSVLRYTAGGRGGEIIKLTADAVASIPDTADYFVEARIRPRQNSTTANKQLYFIGRYVSEGNWYGGGLNLQNSSSSTQVEVAISTDGSLSRPVQKKSPILLGEKGGEGDGTWYRVRFEMLGDDLTVYLDGENMGSVTDSQYSTKGVIGMFTNNRSFELDDFKVGDPSVKPVQLTLDFKQGNWDTTTTAGPLNINVTSVQSDGVTVDNFIITSSDPEVVAVEDTGNGLVVLSPLAQGSATITFTSGTDPNLFKTIEVTIENGFVMPTAEYGSLSGKLSPGIGATDTLIDSSLSITFDNEPTLGSLGEVRIYDAASDELVDTLSVSGSVDSLGYLGQDRVRRVNYFPVTLQGNTLIIKPHNSILKYDASYYIVVGEGVVTGAKLNGLDFVGIGDNIQWDFNTSTLAPSISSILVDDDGAANFRTVQGALNYVMENYEKSDPVTISIKNGTYNELLYLRLNDNITIQGEDRDQTIIQYDNYETLNGGSGGSEVPGTGTPGGGRSVFLVEGADMLVLNNLTLKNSHIRNNANSNQAEAIYFNSPRRLIVNSSNLISEQDTLQLKGYVWFYDSLVAGNVDFIWGYANAALFENSEIRTIGDSKNGDPNTDTSGGYILQARVQNETDKGFVFLNNTFTNGPGPIGNGVLDNSTYLARSSGQSSYFDNITFINNRFDTHIATSGWAGLGVNGQPQPNPSVASATSGWREYGSMAIDGTPLDLTAREHGYVMTESEVANWTVRADIFSTYNEGEGWSPEVIGSPVIPGEPSVPQVMLMKTEDIDKGFAGNNFDITGGADGMTVTVNTGAALQSALELAKDSNLSITIYVDGVITDANSGNNGNSIDIKDMDNVSIIGVANRGEFDGIGISIRRANNIIIQNLKIHHVLTGGKDAISVEGDNDGSTTENIWIDHNELYSTLSVDKDYYDGLIDTKNGAKNITISYNYLHNHWKASLHGHTEPDTESSNTERNITFHHNRFEDMESRLPLFRYGFGHLYNNYYNQINSTAINSRRGAELLIENNVFENTQNPIVSFYTDVVGYWNLSGNVFGTGVTWTTPGSGEISAQDGESTSSYVVPYDYTLEPADVVKDNVIALSGVGKLDQSELDIPEILGGNGETPIETDVSLPFTENFNAIDADTFFSADYKSLPEDVTSPLYAVTGGGSGISISNGEITMTSARFSIGDTLVGTDTSDADAEGQGVFDLSKPYRLSIDIISVSDPDGDNNFQVYVDNNTSSSGKSIHGGISKFYAQQISSLTPGTLVIDGFVATSQSFLQLRTESGGTVVIGDVRIEYLPSDAVLSEDFSATDADTLFTTGYKSLPDDASSAFYAITGGGSGITISNGELTLTSARFSLGDTQAGTDTSESDTEGRGVLDLSQAYKLEIEIISVSDPDGDNNFQVYVDNNTSSSSKSLHGGSSKFYAEQITTLTPGTLVVEGFIATSNSFLQLRTESGGTVVIGSVVVQNL